MRRMGANNDVSFRVVAADGRAPRDGKCLEVLGWYDPKAKGVNYSLKMERIAFWKGRGASITPTVLSLMKKTRAGVKASA